MNLSFQTWYFMDDESRVHGPFSASEIRRMGLAGDTLVSSNRSKWVPLRKADLDGPERRMAERAREEVGEGQGTEENPGGGVVVLGVLLALLGVATSNLGIFGLGIWIASCGAGVMLARPAGLEPTKGGVLGFLFGPFGVMIVVVVWALKDSRKTGPDGV